MCAPFSIARSYPPHGRPVKITENELLEALREFGRADAKRPAGTGWHTLEELARTEHVTVATMRYRLKRAQTRGVTIETATGTALDEEGRAKRATYWRFVSRPKGAK